MTKRALMIIVAVVVGTIVACVGVTTTFTVSPPGCGQGPAEPLSAADDDLTSRYDDEQRTHVRVIVAVGVAKQVPTRGLIIAVATAIQESKLRNLPHQGARNDHDSLGLFQQRPSQGWGTAQQILNPAYAAGKFFDKLITIAGWQTMPLTQAAQAVQISAFPDAYATWETDASALVGQAVNMLTICSPTTPSQLPPDFTLPLGTPPQVVTAIWWALLQLGTPYSFGGSCTAAHSGDPARQCDCSSLVQQAYGTAGVALPRVTGDQQHAGVPIDGIGDAVPGDLIFIPGSDGSRHRPGHVGLYLGNGLVIQAPRTGDVVKISRLESWAGQIAAIRRIAEA